MPDHPRENEGHPEASDVSVRGVLGFAVALAALALIVQVGLWGVFRYFETREKKDKEETFPVGTVRDRRPPQPQLEGIDLGTGKSRRLAPPAASDEEKIEKAIEKMATPEKPSPVERGLRQPSDSSSGRVYTGERR